MHDCPSAHATLQPAPRHDVSHDLVRPQSTVQFPPVHDVSHVPALSHRTVQPPPVHVAEQDEAEPQASVHAEPLQTSAHGPVPEQLHDRPSWQSVSVTAPASPAGLPPSPSVSTGSEPVPIVKS